MNENNAEIRERKNALREEYRAKRQAIPQQERKERDARIAQHFLSSMSYRNASVILLYAATEEEIATDRIAEAALADGKRIAYPRCIPEERRMVFHLIEDRALLVPGAYHLEEPEASLPVYDYEACAVADHAVAITPGVIFDRAGYRVGYGKGYYDRFLRGFGGVRVGFVYSEHVLKCVPRGRFDLSVDMLITEKGVTATYAR